MASQKSRWYLNVVLILTVLVCSTILLLHFKNWVTLDKEKIALRSGFYHVSIPFNELDSVQIVPRIPPMLRVNGFSALEKEKGIFREFKDSLTDKKVYVFADNINQQKLKLVYADSLVVFFNLKDSLETLQIMERLKTNVVSSENPN
ncbi:MAG: hypothetical protein WA810_14010 [Maribacter sp.]